MALTSASLRASASWKYSFANTGFNVSKQQDDLSGSYSADVAVFNHALITRVTLAAAGTSTIDLYALVPIIGSAVNITKFKGLMFVCSAAATGGQLKIEPGAANPFAIFAGTTPSFTMDVGTDGATFFWINGTTKTISATVRNILLTNSGSQSVDCDIFALLGT